MGCDMGFDCFVLQDWHNDAIYFFAFFTYKFHTCPLCFHMKKKLTTKNKMGPNFCMSIDMG